MSLFKNIHKMASTLVRTVVPHETISYRHNTTEVSDAGIVELKHGEWTPILADVQPGIISSFGGKNISEKEYQDMGLDWSHEFFTIWVDADAIGTVAANGTSDQVLIHGNVFNIIQCANWSQGNGWRRMYCERVIDDDKDDNNA